MPNISVDRTAVQYSSNNLFFGLELQKKINIFSCLERFLHILNWLPFLYPSCYNGNLVKIKPNCCSIEELLVVDILFLSVLQKKLRDEGIQVTGVCKLTIRCY